MLYTGLCSITFRSLSVDAIIELATKARLDGIEWGSDVHVPPGDLELAGRNATHSHPPPINGKHLSNALAKPGATASSSLSL